MQDDKRTRKIIYIIGIIPIIWFALMIAPYLNGGLMEVIKNSNNIFDICECGENALEVIYSMDAGKVYCEYPMIALDTNNQYIIIGRNPTSLMLSQDEILELDSVKNDDRTVFSLKKAFG